MLAPPPIGSRTSFGGTDTWALNVAVYVAFVAGVVMLWVIAPPSDHDWYVHGAAVTVCGDDVPILRCVPWTLLKSTVQVRVRDRTITISHGGKEVATHARVDGRRQRVVNPEHWAGLSRSEKGPQGAVEAPPADPATSEFVPNLDQWSLAAEVAA